MTPTLPLPPPGKRAIILPHHQRGDVWLHAWTGVDVRRRTVARAKDPSRRARCENDLELFAETYFPHRYYAPNAVHRALLTDYESAIQFPGLTPIKHAIAAPRSIGKTTDSEIAALWAILYGKRDYVLFIGATGPKGKERVASLQHELKTNRLLREDFPEIIEPILAFDGDPRRAPPDYPWSGDEFRLLNGRRVEGRGIDSSLVGLNRLGVRPDLLIIDDVETLDTIRSSTETEKIEQRLRLEVLRLHDINRPAAYFFICTIRGRGCVADKLTDAKKEPEWRGRRYRALAKEPDVKARWETFMDFCRAVRQSDNEATLAEVVQACVALGIKPEEFEKLTHEHQAALRFYVAHKDEMDAGAEVLDSVRLPLHALYHARATEGEMAFACELQNDPPEDANRKRVEFDLQYLLDRRIGEDEGIVPSWARYLTASVDIGLYTLHWEVDAWDGALQTSALIAQGQQETNVNAGGQYKMTDDPAKKESLVAIAIRQALESLRIKFAEGFPRRTGELITPNLVGVDVGGTAETAAWYETVWRFCKTAKPWVALKGMSPWRQTTADKNFGRNFMVDPIIGRHDCNVDEYKLRVARAYEAPPRDENREIFAGARILHAKAPQLYCKHQTAEYWVEAISDDAPAGKAIKVGWNHDGNKPNHWWDTAWMAYALADIFSTRHNLRESRGKVKYGIVGKAW